MTLTQINRIEEILNKDAKAKVDKFYSFNKKMTEKYKQNSLDVIDFLTDKERQTYMTLGNEKDKAVDLHYSFVHQDWR